MNIRVGLGNDIHRLVPGSAIRLGGVSIPCPYACEAVSDGDVILHALVDALLGVLGQGDIGEHFPESRVRKGEDSRRFVEETLAFPAARNMRIVNIDCIVELERPRLTEWKARIRANMAQLLNLQSDRVNIKAKTAEGMGAVGQGMAVSAMVVVLVELGL